MIVLIQIAARALIPAKMALRGDCMSGTEDHRMPNQARGSRPGWRFDGWGVARGGQKWEPSISRPGKAARIVGVVGWSSFGVLIAAAVITNANILITSALAVAAVTAGVGKLLRRRQNRESDPDLAKA
jgi:hypothetical protein